MGGADRLPQPDSESPPGAGIVGSVVGAEPFAAIVDQPNPAVVVVCVVGAIDLLTAPALHDHLDRLLTAGPHRVVIDLSQVSLLGAAGLSALVSVQRAATQQGTTVQLRAPTRPAAAQSLTITGLDGLFEIVAGTDRDQPPAASAALLH